MVLEQAVEVRETVSEQRMVERRRDDEEEAHLETVRQFQAVGYRYSAFALPEQMVEKL